MSSPSKQPLRVFISGDQEELAEERKRAAAAVDDSGQIPIMWETEGASSRSPEQWYREEIPTSKIYIGIFGLKYSAATCEEYRIALEDELSCLVFVRALDHQPRDNELRDFLDGEVGPKVKYQIFFSPQGLQTKIAISLSILIPKKFAQPVKTKFGLSSVDSSIIRMIQDRKVAFSREMQVFFEDQYSHWSVYNSLKKLADHGFIQTRAEFGLRWYLPRGSRWTDVVEEAKMKSKIVETYARHNNAFSTNGVWYDDYSEFLVENALIANGFVIEGRHTRRFRGVEAAVRTTKPGRPPDLDIVASYRQRHFLGIQVKNRLDYPEASSIRDLLGICRQLDLRPLLAIRMAPPSVIDAVTSLGGQAIVFKRWLLCPPFPREVFTKMQQLGMPVSVYTRTPDFLIARVATMRNRLETQNDNTTG